jgi:hypothetical protein
MTNRVARLEYPVCSFSCDSEFKMNCSHSFAVLAFGKKIWWQESNSVRIPLGIALAIAWGFRLRRIYAGVKNTPKRSPRVRRIEIIVATILWTLIALGVTLLLIFA